ncbi:MAG: TIGR02391 family protein [Sulfuricurvum sp.]|jgi:uncharacterized protein (TIGR02391 family)
MFSKNNFNHNNFNQVLVDAVGNRLQNENYEDAVKQALLFITDVFREKSGLTEDGVSLVSKALSLNSPLIKINELLNDTDQNEQKGVMFLAQGIYSAFRNPLNHTIHTKISEKDCMRQLTIIDMIYDYITRDIQTENKISKALFDLVDDNNKDFYFFRNDYDEKINKVLNVDNLWLYGESGLGKTNSAIYYTLVKKYPFSFTVYCSDLPDYKIGTIIQNIFESLHAKILGEKSDLLNDIDINKSNDKKELQKLLNLIVEHFTSVILIFDDIPELDDDEFKDFYLFLLFLFKNSSNSSKLIITSIVDPTSKLELLSERDKDKLCDETLKFIEFQNWDDSEIIGLKKHIEASIGNNIISDEDAKNHSQGKPRKLKRLMKDQVTGDNV